MAIVQLCGSKLGIPSAFLELVGTTGWPTSENCEMRLDLKHDPVIVRALTKCHRTDWCLACFGPTSPRH